MIRAYKFRIYPDRTQEQDLMKHLWISKTLWNDMLEHVKRIYNDFGRFPTKKALRQFTQRTGLYSQVGQELTDRLMKGLGHKMRKKKEGLKGGFPRFKSLDNMKSLVYPQMGFSLGDKLKVTPFGDINIKQHREIEGNVKTLTVKREPSGKWFAIFVAEIEPQEIRTNDGNEVGIDVGLKNFATLSDGNTLKNPRHLKKYKDELASKQRSLSKKKKRSMNRKKAQIKVARLYEKVSNTRKDFIHKTTTKLVSRYSLISLEKLNIKGMVQKNFGKSINDAGWNMFMSMLNYKAESAGCEVVFVDPKNTTKMCNECGEIKQMPLNVRTYSCPTCGMVEDRDLNASVNILKRATMGHIGSNACGDDSIESSLKQEAHTL